MPRGGARRGAGRLRGSRYGVTRFYFPERELWRLKLEAEREGVSVSALLRVILLAWLESRR